MSVNQPLQQIPLQKMIAERLKLSASASHGALTQLVVDNRYKVTLDFSDNKVTLLACIIELPENLEDQKNCFRRIATARLNLATICREHVYLASEKRLMLRRILWQKELTLPDFEEFLQDFLNTLVYLTGITQSIVATPAY